MWKAAYNVIAAFPTEPEAATHARRALVWGAFHVQGAPVFAPIDGVDHEIRTYRFLTEGQRRLFKARVAKALVGTSVTVEMEDESDRIWVPDKQRSKS